MDTQQTTHQQIEPTEQYLERMVDHQMPSIFRPRAYLGELRTIGTEGVIAKGLTGPAYRSGIPEVAAAAIQIHQSGTLNERAKDALIDTTIACCMAPFSIPISVAVAAVAFKVHPALAALSLAYEITPGGMGGLTRALVLSSRAIWYKYKYGEPFASRLPRLALIHIDFGYLWSGILALPANKDMDTIMKWKSQVAWESFKRKFVNLGSALRRGNKDLDIK